MTPIDGKAVIALAAEHGYLPWGTEPGTDEHADEVADAVDYLRAVLAGRPE